MRKDVSSFQQLDYITFYFSMHEKYVRIKGTYVSVFLR